MSLQQQVSDLANAQQGNDLPLWKLAKRPREARNEESQLLLEEIEKLNDSKVDNSEFDALSVKLQSAIEKLDKLDVNMASRDQISTDQEASNNRFRLIELELAELSDAVAAQRERAEDSFAELRAGLAKVRNDLDSANEEARGSDAATAARTASLERDLLSLENEMKSDNEDMRSKIEKTMGLVDDVRHDQNELREDAIEMRNDAAALAGRANMAEIGMASLSGRVDDLDVAVSRNINKEIEAVSTRVEDVRSEASDANRKLARDLLMTTNELRDVDNDLHFELSALGELLRDLAPSVESGSHQATIEGRIGPRTVFPAMINGFASATHDGITFTADNQGWDGNDISLVFNGTDTVDTVVNAWNAANPTNTVSHDGAGTETPAAATVDLYGGCQDEAKDHMNAHP
jgi:hypothetical protein